MDTSWYIRYRSTTNPDFGATFPQAIKITNRPAIPRTNADFEDANHIQAIANTAAFHFGSSSRGDRACTRPWAKKSAAKKFQDHMAIGGDEIAHFLEWVDLLGNGVQGPPFNFQGANSPVTDMGLHSRISSDARLARLFSPT